jgi:hypothetical protein
MNDRYIKYKSGILAGLVEVIATHPIDFYKTQKQYYAYSGNLQNQFKITNMYNGVFSRMTGIIPMRLIFWCTQDFSEEYLKKTQYNKYKYAIAGGFAGAFQTIVDYPIEQIKIRKMIFKDSYNVIFNDIINSKNLVPGFSFTLFRNIGFAILFNHNLKNNLTTHDSYYHNFMIAAGSGFLASMLTQPLDYFKTIIQSNKTNSVSIKSIYLDSLKSQQEQKFNLKHLVFFKGGWSRSSISFLGMGIGYTIYDTSKKTFCDNNLYE